MLLPVKWLKDYVNIDDIELNDLEDGLILSGSNTEGVETLLKDVKKVVIGKIVEIKQHPNAEKLIIPMIDIGEDEPLQIVTGATNINVGDTVPVALVGSWLPGGVKIKRGKLRGEISNGMLCSLEELGFDTSVIPKEIDDGILILQDGLELGAEVDVVPELMDHVIEFEITPNRPDCLSVIGLARETAATFNLETKYPVIEIKNEVDDINNEFQIEVKNTELCPRFTARMIKDVTIKSSPLWMQFRLIKAGVRPINNIVDITNYVMLEYGQPLHAYDYDTLKGKKIIVRNAEEGEMITTLDESERKLTEADLLICDGERPIGIAGIMGGAETEITDNTKTILLESANFNRKAIRAASRRIGLRTEASSRYEKGIDPNIAEIATNRVCQLIEELGAGTIVKNMIDVYPNKVESINLEVRVARVNKLLGTDISTNKMADILKSLEFGVEVKDDILKLTVPTFRQDIVKEIDIVEEIARIYGYNTISSTLPKGSSWGAKTNGQIIIDHSKNVLRSLGMNEITTYSFVSPNSVDMINLNENSLLRNFVRLINPLGEEYSVMRTTLVPNLLEVLSRNYKRKVKDAYAFEIGNIFLPREGELKAQPVEKLSLVMGLYSKDADFFELKGLVDELFGKLGIKNYGFEPEKNHPTFHPGRCATIVYGNHILGTIGELHPDVLDNYGIDQRAYVADLDYNILIQITRLENNYTPLPKYPASLRDIAIIVKDEVYSKEIEDVIKANGGSLLEECNLFDIYKGKQIEEGKKSMAYSLSFRSADKTLTDKEVNKVFDKILKNLESELDAELR